MFNCTRQKKVEGWKTLVKLKYLGIVSLNEEQLVKICLYLVYYSDFFILYFSTKEVTQKIM